jgi:hypothetical protein
MNKEPLIPLGIGIGVGVTGILLAIELLPLAAFGAAGYLIYKGMESKVNTNKEPEQWQENGPKQS